MTLGANTSAPSRLRAASMTAAQIYDRYALSATNIIEFGGMRMEVQEVSPADAKRYLSTNTGNRRLRGPVVKQYARDMLAGTWLFKPLAVCFDEDGVLGNGQHTLSAIIESGTTQPLLVAWGVPKAAIAKMDRGIQRTVSDVAKFMGSSFESRQASVARVIAYGPTDSMPRSFDELFAAYMEHEAAIEFVCKASPRTSGFSACVLAVCARALYTQDERKISRFLEVLRTGVVEGDHESAAVKLRDFCRSQRGASSSLRGETYRKTQTSLQSFISGRPMTKVYGTPVDLFPLPAKKSV
jgi:hypothetical protein